MKEKIIIKVQVKNKKKENQKNRKVRNLNIKINNINKIYFCMKRETNDNK